MPPVRNNKRSASPEEAFHMPQLDAVNSAAPSVQLIPRPLSFAFPQYDASSPPAPKKKRSHGKARAAGHIPRPPNAFIIFRTEYIKSMATHSTPEMSKNLGEQWKSMSEIEQQPWIEKAREAKEEHMRKFPHYKYKPIHPRDADGKCIRKPRKPNQPRAKKGRTTTVVEDLSQSFAWMEGKTIVEFPNTSLPSDCSSASSPPLSPSPVPSTSLIPPYIVLRRSSSVPLPDSDGKFSFGLALETNVMAHPQFPSGSQTVYPSRRFGKRPSTSMDFTCVGETHPSELHSHNDSYLVHAGDSSERRPNHRRSVSAPMYNEDIPTAQFFQTPQVLPGPNHLTPIDPMFGNVFAKFSWEPTSNGQYPTTVPPQHLYTGLDMSPMTNSPLTNGSGTSPATTPDIHSSSRSYAPSIEHPAPVPTFDFGALHAQFGDLDAAPPAETGYEPILQLGVGNALGLSQQSHETRQLYPHHAGHNENGELQVYPVEQQQVPVDVLQLSEDSQFPISPSPYAPPTDVHRYDDRLHYMQPQESLDFNEFIEGYEDYRHPPM